MKLKKILAAVLAVLLVFSLCACGKMTTERLIAGMAKALTKVDSFSGTADSEIEMDISIIGMDMNVKTALDTDISYSDGVTYVSGDYDVALNGKSSINEPLENYTVIDDAGITNYSLSDGKWYKSSVSAESQDSGNFDFAMLKELLSSENIGTVTLRENLETVNGKEVYVLDVDNCRYTQLALDFILPQIENSLGDIDFTNVDFSGIEMDLIIKVYKDTKLPAELTIDYGDSLTSVMETATDAIIDSIGSKFNSGLDIISMIFKNLNIEIAVPNTVVVINFEEYNIGTVTVPNDALNGEDIENRKKITIFDSLF